MTECTDLAEYIRLYALSKDTNNVITKLKAEKQLKHIKIDKYQLKYVEEIYYLKNGYTISA
jgi:hypothetical protein